MEQAGMGVAVGDLRLDGNLDIVKTHFSADTLGLYINNGKGSFRDMTVRGVQSNRSAIGARVTVRYGERVQAQEVMGQSSYLSCNDTRLHFGLGAATAADIEIRWPLGRIERLPGVAADQLVWITEGAGNTRTEKFPVRRG
jgi:hypothetical protein